MDIATLKRRAAARAVEFVAPGMIVGLGEGSTAAEAIALLAHRPGLSDLRCVPASRAVERRARALGLSMARPDFDRIDLTIDGADEVDGQLDLIKGAGGALLREKILAQSSRLRVIAVDHAKLSRRLGSKAVLPVEVLPFGWRLQARFLDTLCTRVKLRKGADGAPFETDQGNYVLDCDLGPIADPRALAARLDARAGIVEHGLFLDAVDVLVVAGEGGVRCVARTPAGVALVARPRGAPGA